MDAQLPGDPANRQPPVLRLLNSVPPCRLKWSGLIDHSHRGRGVADSNRREAVYEAAETTYLELVGQPGLEPGTSVLSGLRSNRLSYWPFAPESSLGVTARHDEYSRGRPRVQGQVRSGMSRPHYLLPDDCIVRCITGSRGRIGQAGGLVLRRRCPFTEGLPQPSGSAIRGWPFEISESCGGCSPSRAAGRMSGA